METPGFTPGAQTCFGDHPFLNLADILAGQSIDECSAMCFSISAIESFFLKFIWVNIISLKFPWKMATKFGG